MQIVFRRHTVPRRRVSLDIGRHDRTAIDESPTSRAFRHQQGDGVLRRLWRYAERPVGIVRRCLRAIDRGHMRGRVG